MVVHLPHKIYWLLIGIYNLICTRIVPNLHSSAISSSNIYFNLSKWKFPLEKEKKGSIGSVGMLRMSIKAKVMVQIYFRSIYYWTILLGRYYLSQLVRSSRLWVENNYFYIDFLHIVNHIRIVAKILQNLLA